MQLTRTKDALSNQKFSSLQRWVTIATRRRPYATMVLVHCMHEDDIVHLVPVTPTVNLSSEPSGNGLAEIARYLMRPIP